MKDLTRGPIAAHVLALAAPIAVGMLVQILYLMVDLYFGAAAQAGFGVGSRLMQAVFLPAMAVAFAMAPVAGQNYGARAAQRVRRTFATGALLGCGLMLLVTLLCQWRATARVGFFTADPAARHVATDFLRLISWNFVASGFVFTCSGMFQALGNTWPAILSSATRLVTFVLPALAGSRRGDFRIEDVWYLSIATVTLQALVSGLLLRREFGRRLAFAG